MYTVHKIRIVYNIMYIHATRRSLGIFSFTYCTSSSGMTRLSGTLCSSKTNSVHSHKYIKSLDSRLDIIIEARPPYPKLVMLMRQIPYHCISRFNITTNINAVKRMYLYFLRKKNEKRMTIKKN